MNYKKPFYTLRLHSKNAGYALSVNGCLLNRQTTIQPNQMEFPINQWLKNGENSFDIYHLNVQTGFDNLNIRADGEIILELCVRENDEQEAIVIQKTIYQGAYLSVHEGEADYTDEESLLATLQHSTQPCQFNVVNNQINYDNKGAFIIGDYQVEDGITKALHISQKITLPAPFPLWRFFEADELTYHSDLTDEEWLEARKLMVEEVYQPVYQAIKDNDSKALTELFTLRGKEFDQAFYKEHEGQDTYEMVHHLTGLITDPEMEDIRPVILDASDICVAFNKRISWLHNWDISLSSKLAFKHKNAELVTRIPIMFSRFDGKWEIVR